jgi:DNA polymerase-3 subunit alpha
MAALLTQDMGNQDKTIKNISECRGMGIEILPPDINESLADFSVVEGKIRFGLAAVKNVGLKAVEAVIEERENRGCFRDLVDFCKRLDGTKVNRRVLEGLIQCGALDFTGAYRAQLFAALDEVLKICNARFDPNQLSMFGAADMDCGGNGIVIGLPDIREWDEKERARKEKEALGFYISEHPLARFSEEIQSIATCPIQDLASQKDKATARIACVVGDLKIKKTKKGDKMAIVNLEDLSGSAEAVLFPDAFSQFSRLLRGEDPLLVIGTVETGESAPKIIVQEVVTFDSIRQRSVKAIELRFERGREYRELLEDLKDVIFKFPGDCRILFRGPLNEDRQVLIAAHNRFNVLPCEELIDQIRSLTRNEVYQIT